MQPREHFTQQLDALHAELRSLGQMVVAAITWSLDALSRQDVAVARRIVADDQDIDRAQYTIEDHAITVIATQQPVAGDLRQLIATIQTAAELERCADYAKSIARIVIRDAGQPALDPPAGMAQMSVQALAMLPRGAGGIYSTGWRGGAQAGRGRRPGRRASEAGARRPDRTPRARASQRRAAGRYAGRDANPGAHRRPSHQHRRAGGLYGQRRAGRAELNKA